MRQRLIGFTLLVLPGVLGSLAVKGQELQPSPPAGLQTATFAGGCFWCMVHPFEVIDGVISTISGYSGGSVANPTYEQSPPVPQVTRSRSRSSSIPRR